MTFNVMSHRYMSCHVTLCRVVSCHIMPCSVIFCHIMSCHIMSRRDVTWHNVCNFKAINFFKILWFLRSYKQSWTFLKKKKNKRRFKKRNQFLLKKFWTILTSKTPAVYTTRKYITRYEVHVRFLHDFFFLHDPLTFRWPPPPHSE